MKYYSFINEKHIMKYYFSNHIIGFFINPFYIARSNLYKVIKKNTYFVSWKILDFWCWEKPYKKLFQYDEYIWIDFASTWHNNSQKKADIYWNWENIPYKDWYFDSVLSTEVFEHIFDLDLVLSEIYRVLKIWWYIMISIPFCMDEHEQPYDFARYTTFGIKHILNRHWFSVIKQIKTTNYGQTILQLNRMYIGKLLKTKSNIINIIFSIFIIFPLHILINALSFIVIWNWDYYFNQLIIAQKNEPKNI